MRWEWKYLAAKEMHSSNTPLLDQDMYLDKASAGRRSSRFPGVYVYTYSYSRRTGGVSYWEKRRRNKMIRYFDA
jgi:hypothetical protein